MSKVNGCKWAHTDLPFSHVCFLRGGRKHVSHCGSGAGRGPRPEATSEADEISEWPGKGTGAKFIVEELGVLVRME